MREKELEQKLCKAVKAAAGLCLKFSSPGTGGVPDRLLLFKGGRAGFVEVKRPGGGRLSKLQDYWIKRLSALGFPAFILSSPEDIPVIIETIKYEV